MKKQPPKTASPRQRAEARLKNKTALRSQPRTEIDAKRLLHELQVHQLELEAQNAELREARDEAETQLARYTDLYDFAPVGYYSIDEKSRILEVNLTGAALLGVERSRLINRLLQAFVTPRSLTKFQAFLEKVFAARKNRCASFHF